MIDLDPIEARANAATPGPWHADEDSEETGRGVTDDAVEHWIFFATTPAPSEADAAHIAGMDPRTTLAVVNEARAGRLLADDARQVRAKVHALLNSGAVDHGRVAQALRGVHADLDTAIAAYAEAVGE
jgi:hypothetical protein